MRLLQASVLLVILAALPRAGAAQERPPEVRTVVRVQQWGLSEGVAVRVFTRGVGLVEGRLEHIRDQELFLRGDGVQTSIRLAWVDSLWVRTRAGGRGAILGGLGGAVAGAVIGALACGSPCDDRGGAVGIGAVVGGGAGVLGGWIAGTRHHVWSRRHP